MNFLRFLLFFSVVAVSCNVINKEEAIPSFIHLDQYHLDPNTLGPDGLGSGHHNITDAWVSADGQFIGVFELPTTIPILSNGPTEIIISPGIKNFGIATDRQDYLLMENFEVTLNLVPGEVFTLSPEISFFEELILQQASEDYSSQGNTSFSADPGNFVSFIDPTLDSSPLTDDRVGQYTSEGGLLEITSGLNPLFSVVGQGPTFLEFDYKTNENFLVGLKTGLTDNDKTYLLGLTPQLDEFDNPEWNRVYLNLEPFINFFSNTNVGFFNVFFENELGTDSTILHLDNIKVITLEP